MTKPINGPTPKPSSVPVPKMKKGFGGFWKEAMAEMKKVHWPTRAETTRLTGVVFAVCIAVIVFLYGLGMVCDSVFSIITEAG